MKKGKSSTEIGDIQELLKDLSSLYKDVPVLLLGDDLIVDAETISTGSLKLDIAIGAGGVVCGAYNTIYGWESSGKTTIALLAIANAQKAGGLCGYIDSEQCLNKAYAIDLGVDIDRLVLVQPDSAEQALKFAQAMIESNKFAVVVLDSIAALSPAEEVEEGIEKIKMGGVAKWLSSFYRSNVARVHRSETAFIAINQFREKIGLVFGDPRTLPGGHAEKFWASLRIEVSKKDVIKDAGGVPVGIRLHFKIVKNKVGTPYKETTTSLIFGKGIWIEDEVRELAAEAGILKVTGSWYAYGDTKIGQGAATINKLLEDNPELFDELYTKVRLHYGLKD